MRRIALPLALLLVLAACGDDDTATTTNVPTDDGAATTTVTAGGDDTTTTVPTDDGGDMSGEPGSDDCLEIWPEASIQAVFGDGYTLLDANASSDACSFADLPDAVTMSFYAADRTGFEASKTGASAAASNVTDLDICDAGYSAEVAGALVIVEGYSAAQGRVYTATISGVNLDDAAEHGATLVSAAC